MLAEVRDAYARKAQLGEDAITYAHAIKIDAEVLLGGFLKETEKNTGAKGVGPIAVPDGYRNETPTLEELGVTKKLSAEAQALHTIAEEQPEQVEAIKERKKSVTQVRREAKRASVSEAAALPSEKYRVLYADPLWEYGDKLTEAYGPAQFHYPLMSRSELCALDVCGMAKTEIPV